jgi:hypothetical protein
MVARHPGGAGVREEAGEPLCCQQTRERDQEVGRARMERAEAGGAHNDAGESGARDDMGASGAGGARDGRERGVRGTGRARDGWERGASGVV